MAATSGRLLLDRAYPRGAKGQAARRRLESKYALRQGRAWGEDKERNDRISSVSGGSELADLGRSSRLSGGAAGAAGAAGGGGGGGGGGRAEVVVVRRPGKASGGGRQWEGIEPSAPPRWLELVRPADWYAASAAAAAAWRRRGGFQRSCAGEPAAEQPGSGPALAPAAARRRRAAQQQGAIDGAVATLEEQPLSLTNVPPEAVAFYFALQGPGALCLEEARPSGPRMPAPSSPRAVALPSPLPVGCSGQQTRTGTPPELPAQGRGQSLGTHEPAGTRPETVRTHLDLEVLRKSLAARELEIAAARQEAASRRQRITGQLAVTSLVQHSTLAEELQHVVEQEKKLASAAAMLEKQRQATELRIVAQRLDSPA